MNQLSSIGRHLAALVVPFTASLEVDEKALAAVCRHVLQTKEVDGLVVNANAGEVDALTEEERLLVFRVAKEAAHKAGRKVVASVVPVPDTNKAAAHSARQLQDAGADALLLIGPKAFARGVDAVPDVAEAYARDVASAVSIPIIYFMQGPLSGINYTPELVSRICSVKGISAVKDTMWTPQGYDGNMRAIRKLDRGVAVLTGNDNCLFHNFTSGADGTLLVLHCVMADAIVRMYAAVQANDLKRAREIHEQHEALVGLLFQRPMLKMASRIKHVLHHMGVIPNNLTRAPVPVVTKEEAAALGTHFSKLSKAA